MSIIQFHLTKIKYSTFSQKTSVKNKQPSTLIHSAVSVAQERFSQVFGAVILEEGYLFAKHVGRRCEYVPILGERRYSQGRQMIRFMIKFNRNCYTIFFGCISSRANGSNITLDSPFAVGWFGHNQTYKHSVWTNDYIETGYDSSEIRTNDVLCLTFVCENRHIELFHERTNKTHILSVDLDKAPFPWQLLVVLTRKDDCIRILPNV